MVDINSVLLAPDPVWLLIYLCLGALVGLLAGLFGVGGGAIMVPILTAMFVAQGIDVSHALYLALGTSMTSIVVTSISSMRAHHQHNAVLWLVVRAMVPGIVCGAYLSTFVVPYIEGKWLALIFSIFIAYVSLQMLLNRRPNPARELPGSMSLCGVGAGIGGFSALVSIGGGTLTTPYLIWNNVELRRAIGTSAAVGVPISLAGSIGYLVNGKGLPADIAYTYGFIYLPAVISISFASVFFAPLGARFAHSFPLDVIRKLFAAMLIFLSINMLRTYF